MRIFSFDLILAMDFLNKIAEFMTTGMAEDGHKPKDEATITPRMTEKSIDVTVSNPE